MPDLTDFSIVRSGNTQLTVPTWTIKGKIVNDRSGTVLADFSSGVNFPQVLGQLTANQQDFVVEMIVRKILEFRFGV